MKTQSNPGDKKNLVVTKAVARIALQWGLSNDELGSIIGVSAPSISRLKASSKVLHGKEVELGLLLVRVYRSLDAILGGNTINIRKWLESYNDHLCGTPRDLLKNTEGLVNVVRYLDAMRGKI